MQVCWIASRDSIVTIMVHTDVVLYGKLRVSMSSAPKGPVSEGLVNSTLYNTNVVRSPVFRNHEFGFEVSVVQHRPRQRTATPSAQYHHPSTHISH